ncbi:DNA repair protein RecO [Parabacteroides chinchillae]|uniref:DNA repair protein RecO n=1 Tax=Parabacteroides chinchillae TaxID=871327 RepID=A0A8G2BVH3_9BACT|nr:DNA repair protein RecO [Parabacteroides chinchillae]SEF66734.1 DNA replication and repair protein RecO [Parabacteroides chinchillae]
MLSKTRGIVLHSIPYNDKYSIIYMYTEAFGRASYLVARNRGKKSTVSKALFMPLSVLEMEVEHLNKRDLHRIKETKICYPLTALFCNPVKNVLALFLSEVLFRVVKDTEPDARLFGFLYESIQMLEYSEEGVANFHLVFLLRLLYYLGIYPNADSHNQGYYFDMLNGVFIDSIPVHRHYLNREESLVFARLLKISFENMSLFTFSRKDRVRIIERILEYYRLHLPEFPEIKSFSVLQSLFD